MGLRQHASFNSQCIHKVICHQLYMTFTYLFITKCTGECTECFFPKQRLNNSRDTASKTTHKCNLKVLHTNQALNVSTCVKKRNEEETEIFPSVISFSTNVPRQVTSRAGLTWDKEMQELMMSHLLQCDNNYISEVCWKNTTLSSTTILWYFNVIWWPIHPVNSLIQLHFFCISWVEW